MKSLGLHQVTLQLPTEVYDKLRELASADGSLNNAAIDAIMRTPMKAGVEDSEFVNIWRDGFVRVVGRGEPA